MWSGPCAAVEATLGEVAGGLWAGQHWGKHKLHLHILQLSRGDLQRNRSTKGRLSRLRPTPGVDQPPVVQRRTWEAPGSTRHRGLSLGEIAISFGASGRAPVSRHPVTSRLHGRQFYNVMIFWIALDRGWRRASRRRGTQTHSRASGPSDMPARHRNAIAVYAPAHTHDLLRLSHVGLHLFVSPNALQRPLCAS